MKADIEIAKAMEKEHMHYKLFTYRIRVISDDDSRKQIERRREDTRKPKIAEGYEVGTMDS